VEIRWPDHRSRVLGFSTTIGFRNLPITAISISHASPNFMFSGMPTVPSHMMALSTSRIARAGLTNITVIHTPYLGGER